MSSSRTSRHRSSSVNRSKGLTLSKGVLLSQLLFLAACCKGYASLFAHRRLRYPNPATNGLYARWTASISNPDWSRGVTNFVYMTSCKAIGQNYTDADADCLATVANDGHPGVADPDDSNLDLDGDGLLDGVEVAFGTCPGSASDFPSLSVCAGKTRVTARDTDGDLDGIQESGSPDGIPDSPTRTATVRWIAAGAPTGTPRVTAAASFVWASS